MDKTKAEIVAEALDRCLTAEKLTLSEIRDLYSGKVSREKVSEIVTRIMDVVADINNEERISSLTCALMFALIY